MPKVLAADIRINPSNRKHMFVLKYLHMLHLDEIDKKELSFATYQQECDNNTPGMLLTRAVVS